MTEQNKLNIPEEKEKSALSSMIQSSFPSNEKSLSVEYEYSVSRIFELRRRQRGLFGKGRPEEIIQLFQPPSSSVIFTGFKTSNFLAGRDISIERLRRWMDECSSSHNDCLVTSTTQDDSSRPARLLDITPIQRGSEVGIKIIETTSGRSYRYACLSHRWDIAIKHHQTTTENISNFLDFLNLNLMPANFRDAVAIARDLNIQYVWIDSLCIIQSGDSGEDIRRELAKMGSIYQNAYLTIAAVSSPSSSEGCFIKDKWPDICFLVSDNANDAHLIGARVLDKKGILVSLEDTKQHYPLLSRAWVFQERLLSRRILLCNYGEFAFECLESSICECNSSLAPHPRSDLGQNLKWLGNLDFNHTRLLKSSTSLGPGAIKSWKTIIETYMQLELSYLSDTLPAIAGCAQVMALHLNHNYVAGLWEETLPTDLLWYVQARKGRTVPKPRAKGSTAPSWSWA
ncbi:HET-domain-containing protein, partial [Melanomma pulvis-pyrius CBS 109.77]